jgi:hypothetical protein
MLAISITSKTINPVQWSGPATRLGFAILLGIILLAGFGYVAKNVPKRDVESTWAGSMAFSILVFAAMLVGYGVIPHEWLTFADSIMRWDDDHFVWHHGDLGGLLFIDFTKRSLRDVVVVIIYGFILTSNVMIMSQWQRRPKADAPPAETVAVEPTARPAGISRFGRPLSRRA